MTGLIDYAGLFPPAGLDTDTAAGNYAGYLAGENGWMLGRLIVPATRLHQLAPHPGFRCSVIVSPTLSREELNQLRAFQGRVEMVETRFAESDDSAARCRDRLLRLESELDQAGLRGVQLFVEAADIASTAVLASSLADFNRSRGWGSVIDSAGYKLRCGGLAKETIPAAETVAEAIRGCRHHDIPIKFTAGMHQPLHHNSPELASMQHGFINIFAAALLAWGCNLDHAGMTACLQDETAGHFHFTDAGFSWQGHTISSAEIEQLRHNRVISFGSCSFTEPVAGLRALGFLAASGA